MMVLVIELWTDFDFIAFRAEKSVHARAFVQ